MPLKPYDLSSTNVQIPDELNEILNNAGVGVKSTADKEGNLDIKKARQVFDDSGASVENAAKTISRVMDFGETDAGRLKAAELAIKVHGVLTELSEKPVPQITINVSNQFTQENKTLINLVVPS